MNIMLVDDHPVVRQGLRLMLTSEPGLRVVAEAASATEALHLLASNSANAGADAVQLLVLDLNLPDRNGFAVLESLQRTHPALPVLILSIQPAEHMAVRALKAGARGFLNKEAAPDELVRAIRTIGQGRKYISQNLAEWLATEASGQRDSLPHERLSDREFQVLCLLAGGKSISDIAHLLNRSPNTISTYRARILEKMGIDNNAGLVQYALEQQLIQ
jgi:DNA-binding NarL/FixJ family response regulator